MAINNLEHINPNFKYTIFKGEKSHNAWSKAYLENGLEEWMESLNRKNNKDNSQKVLDNYKTNDSLTKASVKSVPIKYYLKLTYDATSKDEKYSNIINEHSFRYGSSHDEFLAHLLKTLYTYQNLSLNQKPLEQATRFIDLNKAEDFTVAIPIKGFQKIDIKEPFELYQSPPFKCYWCYYISENGDPEYSLNKMRRLAKENGYTLSGKDRVVYHQMLFSDKCVYELQIGIK